MCCASGSLRKLAFSNLPVSEVTFWNFPGIFWQICCHGPLGVLLWCSSNIYRLWSEMDGVKSELRCGYGLERNATEGFCCCTFTTVEFLGTQYVISFTKISLTWQTDNDLCFFFLPLLAAKSDVNWWEVSSVGKQQNQLNLGADEWLASELG